VLGLPLQASIEPDEWSGRGRANATVPVATTAMINRVLSEDRRSKTSSLGRPHHHSDDRNAAMLERTVCAFAASHSDEALGVGGDRRGLCTNARSRARIIVIGRIAAVDS